jgi:hypothetical protein
LLRLRPAEADRRGPALELVRRHVLQRYYASPAKAASWCAGKVPSQDVGNEQSWIVQQWRAYEMAFIYSKQGLVNSTISRSAQSAFSSVPSECLREIIIEFRIMVNVEMRVRVVTMALRHNLLHARVFV